MYINKYSNRIFLASKQEIAKKTYWFKRIEFTKVNSVKVTSLKGVTYEYQLSEENFSSYHDMMKDLKNVGVIVNMIKNDALL